MHTRESEVNTLGKKESKTGMLASMQEILESTQVIPASMKGMLVNKPVIWVNTMVM